MNELFQTGDFLRRDSMNTLMLAVLSAATLVVSTASVAQASELRYTAKVYELGKSHENVLFNYRSESDEKGDTVVVNNHFYYPDGRLATHEEITFQKDGHVSLYKQEQAQLGATGSIEIGGGKAKFSFTRDGKTKTDTEDIGPEFIVGSQIPLEIEAHWAELMKGETMKRRLAVLERCESVGFNYSKEGEGEVDGKKAVIIKMKPSSFIIAALVSPLHFYMSPDGKELYEIKGRTTVKKDKGGGKFGDLDADIVYTKGPAATQTPAPAAPAAGGNSK
jgi:hypothetical protein